MKKLALLSLALTLLAAGCGKGGPTTYPITGTIKVKGGGPVTEGNVQFQSGKFTGSGMIGPDGKYSLSGLGNDSGIPEGTYKVVLLSTEIGAGYNAKPGVKPKRVVDPKYEDQSKTPIEVKVPGGSYDFEVDPFVGG